LKIARQKEQAHGDASEQIAEDDLQEAEVAGVGYAGDADDGERAGLCGDDGKRDGPPGDSPAAEKVAAQCARLSIFATEAQAEDGDGGEIDEDEDQVRQAQVDGRDGEGESRER
jgi:hypothetical protein